MQPTIFPSGYGAAYVAVQFYLFIYLFVSPNYFMSNIFLRSCIHLRSTLAALIWVILFDYDSAFIILFYRSNVHFWKTAILKHKCKEMCSTAYLTMMIEFCKSMNWNHKLTVNLSWNYPKISDCLIRHLSRLGFL